MFSYRMRRLLTPVFRGNPKTERTLRLLRRFRAIGHIPGSLPSARVFGTFEGCFEESLKENFGEYNWSKKESCQIVTLLTFPMIGKET